MEEFIKRSRLNLSEDELLKEQEKFLHEKKNSNFRLNVEKIVKSEKKNCQTINSDQSMNDEIEKIFMPLNIYEKDTRNIKINEIKKISQDSNIKLIKLNENIFKNVSQDKNFNCIKQKSLFSQYREQKRIKSKNTTNYNNEIGLIDGSGLVNNLELAIKEVDSIKKQNDEILKNLSPTERDQLIQDLNLKKLNFNLIELKKKRNLKQNTNLQKNKLCQESYNLTELNNNEKMNQGEDSFNKNFYITQDEVKENNWLNMDILEKEKLEWLLPLKNQEKKHEKFIYENKIARFKFDGDIVLNEDDYRKGLHHHSEQDRAGYTINELINLTQSKFDPQKIISLNTLSNIFKKMHRGYFDICFNKSLIHELIENTEILIILRKLLDEKNISVLLAAIKCLCCFVCNTIYDEYCLDRLFCSIELGIEIPKLDYSVIINENEYKDEQYCKINVINCLIRMNILPRLRYILNYLIKDRNDYIVLDNILDLLIRICRSSIKSCEKIIQTPYLLETLINKFNSSVSLPDLNWKVLKIIRIIFTCKKDFVKIVKGQFPALWITLRNYLILNPLNFKQDNANNSSFLIIIETLRIWRVLLILNDDSNETVEEFIEIALNLKNCMHLKILEENSFDLHYVSNLLQCVTIISRKKPETKKFLDEIVQNLIFKWVREMLDYNQLTKLSGSLALASGINYLSFSSIPIEIIEKNLLNSLFNDTFLNDLIKNFISNSSILHYKEYRNSVYRDSKALPSFGSIYFGGKTIELNKLLNENSLLFLVGPLTGLIAKFKLTNLLEKFFYNEHMNYYFDKIVEITNKSNNWTIFELIEFNIVCQFLIWENKYLNEQRYFYHSFYVLPSIADEQLKLMLYETIFNVKRYKKLFDNLIENGNNDLKSIHLIKSGISFFYDIKKVYLKYCKFSDKLWIFEPLVSLLNLEDNDENVLNEDELINNLTNCLNYLVIVFNFNQDYLWSIVEPKVFFVYISSIFLFKKTLFLNDNLSQLLEYFFKKLIVSKKIIFDSYEEKLPEPFESVGSFFNQICINFSTDSYGNWLFSNYILCFLTQYSDKIFSKKFYTEHISSLAYFSIKEDQLLIDIKEFIQPVIKDVDFLKIYLRLLLSRDITLNRTPLLYKIFVHQLRNALFDYSNEQLRIDNKNLFQSLFKSLEESINEELRKDILL